MGSRRTYVKARGDALKPVVQAFVEDVGLYEFFHAAQASVQVSGLKWYSREAAAVSSYNRWLKGDIGAPENHLLDAYEWVMRNWETRNSWHQPEIEAPEAKVEESQPQSDTLVQVELALSCTDLPKSEQFKILSIVAAGLEKGAA